MIQTNFFPQPEKDKPIKIIQIEPSGFQPRKVEELLPDVDILSDTYMIYPTGGYHPFYGVPNTFPRYQLPIWPCVKRIKYSDRWLSEESLNKVKTINITDSHVTSQLNYVIGNPGYPVVTLHRKELMLVNDFTNFKKNGQHKKTWQPRKSLQRFHRLVASAWIPNPDNKPLVMHINDDPTNYLPENLVWGTQKENIKGRIRRRPGTLQQKYLNCVTKGHVKG